MDCDRTRDLLSDYVEKELPEDDRAAVAAHLDGCARCAAEAAGLSQTIAVLSALPREKAPPELLGRVMNEIEREAAGGPGRERRFSRFRVGIPLEAAAAVLLLLLVYGVQRGMPVRPRITNGEGGTPPAATTSIPEIPPPPQAPPPARSAAKKPPAVAMNEMTPRAVPERPARPAPSAGPDGFAPAGGETRAESRDAGPSAASGMTASLEAAAPLGHAAAAMKAAPVMPAVPAARVSSAEEPIEPKAFAAPPSRLFKPVPYGRELTLDVASADRAGIEERIVAAAERVGGGVHPKTELRGQGARPPDAVLVHLPEESAGAFLDALKGIGTIPAEGMPRAIDIPAGPSPGIVAYTVRIRVR